MGNLLMMSLINKDHNRDKIILKSVFDIFIY